MASSMTMDTDIPFETQVVKKYITPVEEQDIPQASTKETARLMQPAELRQMIYGYLGYPIAGKVWAESPCSGQLVQARIVGYDIRDFDIVRTTDFIVHLHAPTIDCCDGQRTELVQLMSMLDIDRALLCTNKFIRSEVLQLLQFHQAAVSFCLDLLPDARFFGQRMLLHSSLFNHLTSITLDSIVGTYYLQNHPHHPSIVRHRRTLEIQALSIRFLADNCPFLETFSYAPYLKGSFEYASPERHKLRHVAPKATECLVLAFKYLVQKCKFLDELVIPRVVDYFDIEDGYYFLGELVPITGIFEYRLDVGVIPEYLREDEIAYWAGRILRLMRDVGPIVNQEPIQWLQPKGYCAIEKCSPVIESHMRILFVRKHRASVCLSTSASTRHKPKLMFLPAFGSVI
ncbi:hypothetical protein BDV95DRAFT_589521 [Massariosphaeria phaeospora]|uniref:Uncharacterized protein n=1 Tax=Massariosphaeria phaeospora TaxID=100035 RepID=A0A7C8IJB5_9PLEO|nr:hypothetical protein BDV95DRAFT_589521 [Massariosphaeria phaeospora]